MRGLVNLGNTCYFSTAVQCLAHVPPLSKHFFDNSYNGNCEITKEYRKVVMNLFRINQTGPVNPVDLLKAFCVKFPDFAHGGQHDAQEVVIILLDVFEKSLGKELIQGIFNGQDTQEVAWAGGKTSRTSPFTVLLLDVEAEAKLEDLVTRREEPRPLENYTDDSGETHIVAAVRNIITQWPKILGISFSMYMNKYPVHIPLEFQGRRLFSCIIHHGIQQGGHYALLVRRYDSWYIKDDENVREVPEPKDLRGAFYMAWYR
jgi:ubiquitin C-terminal hydrolase